MRSLIASLLVAAAVADVTNHWVVLMAGSNGYANYRHQADTHHAVKVHLAAGVPRSQIIHMAYDDIANNSRNPFPGQIFNAPDPNGPGVNVYDASEIDYTGNNVNKGNFFKVLLGDSSAPGPVLKSNSDSRVFVYYTDHGGVGLIADPTGDMIYADELNSTLQNAKTNGMFKELVFYVDADETGSLFPYLTEDGGIYAVTSTDATHSSWGNYCGSDAMVNGKNIGSCLGDLFSTNWLEDSDGSDMSTETIAE